MGDLRRLGRLGALRDGRRMVHFEAERCTNCTCGAQASVLTGRLNAHLDPTLQWPLEQQTADSCVVGTDITGQCSEDQLDGAGAELLISSRGFHEATAVIFGGPLALLFGVLVIASSGLDWWSSWWTLAAVVSSALLWVRLVVRYRPRLRRQLAIRLSAPWIDEPGGRER